MGRRGADSDHQGEGRARGSSHDAWIVPRDAQSALWTRVDPRSYREGASPIVEVGPVDMPARSVHRLDAPGDRLVFAHKGELTVVRQLSGERASSKVKIPGSPAVHAITMIDDVVYTGADAGRGMLGWVDLRGDLAWKGVDLPSDVAAPGKGIDGFAVRGRELIAVDDIVMPRYLLVIDVADPRAPRFVERRVLPTHSSGERIESVAWSGDTLVMLSNTANHGAFATHVAFMDVPTLEEWAKLRVQSAHSVRRFADRSYHFHSVALFGDLLFIAAGADGIGLLRAPPRPANLAPRSRKAHEWTSTAHDIPIQDVRFVPVPGGPVVDVVPVDEARAFAVFQAQAGGAFKKPRFTSELVSLAYARDPR